MKTAHLNALRALEAVLRLGSLRAAADELHVTSAAVGQQVRVLEGALGRKLLDRRPGGAVPTDAARGAAARLTRAFADLSEVLADLSLAEQGNRVAVTMTVAVAEGWLPRELPDFFARAPEVDLRLDSSRATVDLARGEFDFAIRHMGPPGADFAAITLFPSFMAPVCTPDFARRYRLTPETRSLGGVPLNHVPVRTSDPDWVDWPGWCARFGLAPDDGQAQQVSAGFGGLRFAQAGLGLTLSALVDSFDALRRGDLVLPFGPDRVLTSAYSYRLIWLKDRRLSPLQRLFRDWIAGRGKAQADAIEGWLASGARPG
ncbi:MAG: LysR substrate-binding domain-containing protein [Rhodobacteraceae bacterium]|nr:LysR substrate-binding domain-containing protein [Paracoccaceae bacterium]